MLTKIDIRKIIDFANAITPSNWNVGDMVFENYMYKPNVLNIRVLFTKGKYTRKYTRKSKEKQRIIGEVSPMYFDKISFLKDHYPEAKEALERYGNGFVAWTEIWIPSNPPMNPYGIILHELAHVAEARYCAWKEGLQQRRDDGLVLYGRLTDDGPHGKVFVEALELFLDRLERYQEEHDLDDAYDNFLSIAYLETLYDFRTHEEAAIRRHFNIK